MAGLFDFETPEQVRARIGKTGAEQDLTLAALEPAQRANLGGATAGRLFAQALQGAMGYESPEVKRARDIQTAMQSANVEAEGDLGKFYKNLATSLKDSGYVAESFQALQAMQAYNAQQAKAAREEREVTVKEEELARKKEESIPGPKKLAVMEANAAANAKRAQAAMIAALAKQGGAQTLRNWKSKPVTQQNIKSVATQLSNDEIYNKLDDDQQGAYLGTIAQAASDLVEVSKARGKTLTFAQAQEMVKATADNYVVPGMLWGATFNKEGFMADFLGQIQ